MNKLWLALILFIILVIAWSYHPISIRYDSNYEEGFNLADGVRNFASKLSNNNPVTCTFNGSGWTASDPSYQCATSTSYWDCSRPTCSWNPNSCSGSSQYPNCANDSGQDYSGTVYTSPNNQPYYDPETNTVYATAAVSGSLSMGQSGGMACGRCYELNVTPYCGNPYVSVDQSDPTQGGCNSQANQNASGTRFVVMATNFCPDSGCPANTDSTNQKLANYHFDIALPGGGTGGQNSCGQLYNNYSGNFMNGVTDISQCSDTSIVPTELSVGCQNWFNYLKGMNNPIVAFKEIECPTNIPSYNGLNGTS